MPTRHFAINWAILIATLSACGTALGVVEPDVANTKHNLSSSGPGPVKAVSESQICVFCHTPHHATMEPKAPLWNRQLSGATYSPYTSNSMEATGLGQPGGSSKLCLSCHDGTLALGAVNVLNGVANPTIDLGTTTTMPAGEGTDTGFTRNLGTDLGNDHPISFTYNSTLASDDGELRDPAVTAHIANRVPGLKPTVPLEDNQVQCISCHDPHIRDTTGKDIKFLRLSRFQEAAPTGGSFDQANDIICLACHNKDGWSGSAHANALVADEQYDVTAAGLRDFPSNLPVWQAGCLNCHDTHTVQGARRLLREGTNDGGTPKHGGSSAIEETCYQCHDGTTAVLTNVSNVPNIKTDFTTTTRYMPIANTPEVHDIGTGSGTQRGKDFIESQALLGKASEGGSTTNRHAECTDCHNPHRVTKNRLFNANPATPDAAGTHTHETGTMHTNLASGVLRGSWGVEPNYGSASWGALPSSYTVKRGDGGIGASTARTAAYVTREYQICLKCHSDYAYDTPPTLGSSSGGTPYGTNGLTDYTNQAMEIQAPTTHQGLSGSPGNSGAFAGIPPLESYFVDFQTNNRRGWHPVADSTGRSPVRVFEGNDINAGTSGSAFLSPWDFAVGTQTMYCSDCHGSDTPAGTAEPVGGENGNPWGPHGSINDFLLKGSWNDSTGTNYTDGLCFKCHDYNAYANPTVSGRSQAYMSGFSGQGTWYKIYNMHLEHANRMGKIRCSWCHLAVPHGWKNKALLVNLNDVGPEALCRQEDIEDGVNCTLGLPMSPGTQVRLGLLPQPGGSTDPYYWNKGRGYTNPPYYMNAVNKIINFKDSGNWMAQDCGSVGSPGTGETGMCGGSSSGWATQSEGCSQMP